MNIPYLRNITLGNTDITADCLSILVKNKGGQLKIVNQVNFLAMLIYRKAVLTQFKVVFMITVHSKIYEASCVYLPDLAKLKMTWLGIAMFGLRNEFRPRVNLGISLEKDVLINPRSAGILGSVIAFKWLHN